MLLRAIIVDDEMPARENLAMLLTEFCKDVEIIAKCGNIREAREKIVGLQPDVVFLDIRMPSANEGFDLLDSIEEKNFLVVFVTAFKDYAIRAFNANAVYYVLKPIEIEELQWAVQKVSAKWREGKSELGPYHQTIRELSASIRANKPSSRVTIHHQKGIKIVQDDEIVYLEADGNCTQLFFSDGSKYLDTRTLAVYEDMLNPEKFYRIHKSSIINLNYLTDYISEDGSFAVLKTGVRLAVSRSRTPDFIRRIKQL